MLVTPEKRMPKFADGDLGRATDIKSTSNDVDVESSFPDLLKLNFNYFSTLPGVLKQLQLVSWLKHEYIYIYYKLKMSKALEQPSIFHVSYL